MIRSGACIMGTLLFAASFSVNALTSNDFDPRDPAIWQEENRNALSTGRNDLRSASSSGLCNVGG